MTERILETITTTIERHWLDEILARTKKIEVSRDQAVSECSFNVNYLTPTLTLQTLTVSPDPRITIPQSAYQEQFTLAKQVETLRAPLTAALDEAEKLAAKLTADPARLQRVIDVSGVINSSNAANLWWLPPKSTTTLRFLDGALQRLAGAIDSADAAPTADARTSYTVLKPQVEAALKAWGEVKAQSK